MLSRSGSSSGSGAPSVGLDSLLAKREALLAKRAALQDELKLPMNVTESGSGEGDRRQLIRSLVGQIKPEILDAATDSDLDNLLLRVCVRARRNELQQHISAYRLMGISFNKISPSAVLVRLDSFYDGRYLDRFYMELKFNKTVSLGRHTLPHVLPVAQLSRRFLRSGNAKLFFLKISKYLNAYAGRRCEIEKALSQFARWIVENSLKMSAFVVYVKFRLRVDEARRPVEVTMVYDDLEKLIPTRARVLELGDEEVSNRPARRLLKKDILSRSLKTVLELYGCNLDEGVTSEVAASVSEDKQ